MNYFARLFLLYCITCSALFSQTPLTKYVNPFVGTDAHGHTFPGATLPFGMVQLSPDTDIRGWDWCSGYHSSDSSIIGFSHTHLSGTGAAALGDILLMPVNSLQLLGPGDKRRPFSGYRSRFEHSSEVAEPGYYRVLLKDSKIGVELTATERTGFHKYQFMDDSGTLIIDLSHGINDKTIKSTFRVVSSVKLEGERVANGWGGDRHVYFAIEFNCPCIAFTEYSDSVLRQFTFVEEPRGLRGYFSFPKLKNKCLLVKVGLSYVDIEGAWKNLRSENPVWDFDAVRASASKTWEKELEKIEIEGNTENTRQIFYTAFYHTMMCPNLFSDIDGRYRGMDKKIHNAESYNHYSVFSLWDTFRAEHPLFTIIDKKRTRDFVLSLLNDYSNIGRLPVWELNSNETDCMIGYHAVPVIADAIVKGVSGIDTALAFRAMVKSADFDTFGVGYFNSMGYIPSDLVTDAVSRSLEYAYDDWCIAQIARLLGKDDEYRKYLSRSLSYRNTFDSETGFMRGKMSNGLWRKNFDPYEPFPLGAGDYTEANAWQYLWSVQHNVYGLIDLLGGELRFINKLDSLYVIEAPSKYRKLSDVTGLIGQYAHGNEPSHHTAFLYNFTGQAWKTQLRVRQIMKDLYSVQRNGLCGNDDCGQMSAWYIFASIGFYPFTPGSSYYTWSSPLFDKIKLHLESGKTFEILCRDNFPENPFIQRIWVNGTESHSPLLDHNVIENGGRIEIEMGSRKIENYFDQTGSRKSEEADVSKIKPIKKEIFVPYTQVERACFRDSLVIPLYTSTASGEIHYTIDGSSPSVNSKIYTAPIVLRETTNIKAITTLHGICGVDTFNTIYYRTVCRDTSKGQKFPAIISLTPYDSEYCSAGQNALIDGNTGTNRFRNPNWQGYYGNDLEAVIDLGEIRNVSGILSGFLSDPDSWILLPLSVVIGVSTDGVNFSNVYTNEIPCVKSQVAERKEYGIMGLENIQARFVKVSAKNVKELPLWHYATGKTCFIFADEIKIF
ncbi:MAG: GH92 family glycosyl hydrolase [Ignavibacteria bacterium]|nr:GH92 family glycosyl hydrolase [Ignavibacteria bacterium]